MSEEFPVRLNLGSGDHRIDGWFNIDAKDGQRVEHLPEVVRRSVNGDEYVSAHLTEGSVDEIRASHVLEHLSFADAERAVAEWARLLKIGGIIRIAVPDAGRIIRDFGTDGLRYRYLMGGQQDSEDFHRSAYDRETLGALFRQVGLRVEPDWTSELPDCASLPVSLNMTARKIMQQVPVPGESVRVKIMAVASVPRLGFQAHWGSTTDAFGGMGIPVIGMRGAYWEQGIEKGIERALEGGAEWIIATDYDSVFTKGHLSALISRMVFRADIDALCAMQVKRGGKGHALATAASGVDHVTTRDVARIRTGHFGLTILRAEAIRRTPRPWFQSFPGPDGRWEHPDHVDADIWFWRQWEKAGNTLFLDTHVSIGHIEDMLSYLAPETDANGDTVLTAKYVPIHEYVDMCHKSDRVEADQEWA